MGNSFVLFDVSIVISHGQFHCGNRDHTQNTDFPWVKSRFPVGKRSSGTAIIVMIVCAWASRAGKGGGWGESDIQNIDNFRIDCLDKQIIITNK